MGNVTSVFGRDEPERHSRNALSEEEFVNEAVAGLELNNQDYQLTLHQYLSQRYAERYNTNNFEQNQQDQGQQRQRSHEIAADHKLNGLSSSFNQSNGELVLLSLKGKHLKEIPQELFYHDDITNLDLSNNGKLSRE